MLSVIDLKYVLNLSQTTHIVTDYLYIKDIIEFINKETRHSTEHYSLP